MPSRLILHVDGLTDIGNRRLNNEDAWWAGQLGGAQVCMEAGPAPLALPLGAPALAIVSDGVGGANAGEVASSMTVNLVSAGLSERRAALATAAAAAEAMLAAINAANAAITAKAAEPGFDGMGSTVSALCIGADGWAVWGQAGDSRIYVCRHGRLRQISRDHSPVGRLRQEGKITEDEAKVHPMRNQIDQSLGDPNKPFRPDCGTEAVAAGDVFLLCSDGLSDGLYERDFEKALAGVRTPADLRPAIRSLVEGVKQAGGRDNITAVAALVAAAGAGRSAPSPWWRKWIER